MIPIGVEKKPRPVLKPPTEPAIPFLRSKAYVCPMFFDGRELNPYEPTDPFEAVKLNYRFLGGSDVHLMAWKRWCDLAKRTEKDIKELKDEQLKSGAFDSASQEKLAALEKRRDEE